MAKSSALFDDGTGDTSAVAEVRTNLTMYPQYELVDVSRPPARWHRIFCFELSDSSADIKAVVFWSWTEQYMHEKAFESAVTEDPLELRWRPQLSIYTRS